LNATCAVENGVEMDTVAPNTVEPDIVSELVVVDQVPLVDLLHSAPPGGPLADSIRRITAGVGRPLSAEVSAFTSRMP
jgi:hypothetical protein